MRDQLLRIDHLLTAAEVAALFRVPRSTIYALARAGRMPFLRIGRRILFDPGALANWVVDQSVIPAL